MFMCVEGKRHVMEGCVIQLPLIGIDGRQRAVIEDNKSTVEVDV